MSQRKQYAVTVKERSHYQREGVTNVPWVLCKLGFIILCEIIIHPPKQINSYYSPENESWPTLSRSLLTSIKKSLRNISYNLQQTKNIHEILAISRWTRLIKSLKDLHIPTYINNTNKRVKITHFLQWLSARIFLGWSLNLQQRKTHKY